MNIQKAENGSLLPSYITVTFNATFNKDEDDKTIRTIEKKLGNKVKILHLRKETTLIP